MSTNNSPSAALSLLQAPEIASHHIQPPTGPSATALAIELSQARHRIRVLSSAGGIAPGSRVLELGCGQGTCTAVLASAVGATGHVDAVDPSSLDYGAPFTLGQAQGHLSRGPLGGRIAWHRADPVDFLGKGDGVGRRWDVAVLMHCLWYFRSVEQVRAVLAALKGRVGRVLIAEYAMHASEREGVPHVLAAVARGALEAHRGDSAENIQTLLSPSMIRELAEAEGWKVGGQRKVVPEAELSDGGWEVGSVLGKEFLDEVAKVPDEKVRAMLRSARDAVAAATEGVGGVGKVTTMDVWVATLVAGEDGSVV